MPNYGVSFLSRVLDDGNTMAIRDFSVDKEDFATVTEQGVYEFITDYARTNKGKTPDFRTVIEKYPEFYYREGVADSYRYLVKELRSYSAQRKLAPLFAGNPDERGGPTRPTADELVHNNDGNVV